MASNGAIPPPIPEVPEDQKFDGGVRISWAPVKRKITNSLRTQGLTGYIDGTIKKPSPLIASSQSDGSSKPPEAPSPTSVYSTNPSLEEWTFRNDRTKGVIEAYVDDLTSLISKADSMTAAELMDAFESEYAAKDEMRKVLTEKKLRSYTFRGGEPIEAFFRNIRVLRKEAVEAGNGVDDSTFCQIILAAFPSKEFDTIIQTVSSSPQNNTPASVIQAITFAYSRIEDRDQNKSIGGDQIGSQAYLAARIEELEKRLGAQLAVKGTKTDKECFNCGRKGHFKEDCFRKGGGKEGQYPSWWRVRKEPTSSSTSANLAVTNIPQHYAMMASQDLNYGSVFADSAASDHFFRDRADFITYEPYISAGQSSEENTSFEIVGRGRACKTLYEGKTEITLTFENALHAPNITSDLISIGCLDQLGYHVLFGNGQAKFFSPKGIHFLTGYGSGRLYRLMEKKEGSTTTAALARSLNKATDLETWHRWFAHAGLSLEDRDADEKGFSRWT